jgi:microcystin-dependent protein
MASEPFIGEVRIFSFGFAPKGWALCNGQLLPINQNQALFSILGTTYGGDGRTTFGLPDLQARTPIHVGRGFVEGQNGGEQTHTLTINEMPIHTHAVKGSEDNASLSTPVGNFWAKPGQNAYSNAPPNASLNPATVLPVGGSQAHNNMSPYLVLNFAIALQGIFPSRN